MAEEQEEEEDFLGSLFGDKQRRTDSSPHRYSWELPPDSPEYWEAVETECNSIGMSKWNYVQLPVDKRRERLVATEQAPRRPELHATDVAIIIAIGGSAFCAGLFGYYESYPVLGTALLLGGLMIMAPISPFIRSHVSRLSSRPVLWAVAVAAWLFLAADIGLRISGFGAAPRDAGKQSANQERTIQELKAEVAVLSSSYWNGLTPTELSNLAERLKKIPSRPVTISCTIAQCRDLARSLLASFGVAGWADAKIDEDTQWVVGGNGIEIMPGDDTAKLLKIGIESTTNLKPVRVSPYNSQISGVGPNQTVIAIGLRPPSQ